MILISDYLLHFSYTSLFVLSLFSEESNDIFFSLLPLSMQCLPEMPFLTLYTLYLTSSFYLSQMAKDLLDPFNLCHIETLLELILSSASVLTYWPYHQLLTHSHWIMDTLAIETLTLVITIPTVPKSGVLNIRSITKELNRNASVQTSIQICWIKHCRQGIQQTFYCFSFQYLWIKGKVQSNVERFLNPISSLPRVLNIYQRSGY